jgi:preprotein translocase subunit YajC
LRYIQVVKNRFQNPNDERKIEMNNTFILAQTEANQAPSDITSEPVASEGTTTKTGVSDSNTAAGTPQRKGLFDGYTNLLFVALMIVVMYLVIFRAPRKKEQQHKQMVESLQKNDKVRTIGGIIGTVVDIKDDEVTLKVDESTNTKIKVIASAIGKKLSKENN